MLPNLLKFAVNQRYLVLVVSSMLALLGVFSLNKLPIDAVPDITNRQVQINTISPSLSPAEMEKQVTFVIETALAGIPGLEYTRSLSRNGFSQVTAVFTEDTDIYFARQQIAERLTEARETLPPEVEPAMGAITTGLGEVYIWSVEYDNEAPLAAVQEAGRQSDGSYLTPDGERLQSAVEKGTFLRTVEDWIIRPQLKSIEGLAGVDTIGGYVKHYQVEADPLRLASFKLRFQDLIEALESGNVATGAGYIEHRGESFLVRADTRITNPQEIESIPVILDNGNVIRVKDVARVKLGKEIRTGNASKNGIEVVLGTAVMLTGENSRKVAAAVDERLKKIAKSLPSGVVIKPVLNRTKIVDATINTVKRNLLEAAIFVILVLFLMLGHLRAALITAAVIPLSMLMLATGMVQCRISGNLMSLGALDFGLIVDGAVIIVENYLRRLMLISRQLGRQLTASERLELVSDATKEMIRPSVFGQGIIIMSYLPLLTLSGVEGKMFHPMAMTVIIALVSAFLVSLTFVPAMLAIFVKDASMHSHATEESNAAAPVSTLIDDTHLSWLLRKIQQFYLRLLGKALRHTAVIAGGAAAIIAVATLIYFKLGQEFIPTLDEQDIALETSRMLSMGITQSSAMQLQAEVALAKIPELDYVFSKLGTAEMATDPVPPSGADTYLIFKPRDKWPDPKKPKEDVVVQILETLSKQTGTGFEFSQPIEMRFNELIAGVRSDVAVKIFGDDFAGMQETATAVAALIGTIPGAKGVKVEQTSGFPTMNMHIDRNKVARYGFKAKDVQDIINIAIAGRKAGEVFEGDRRFDIVVRSSDDIREDVTALRALPVPFVTHENAKDSGGDKNRSGIIPLGNLASIEMTEGLNQVSRDNGKRRVVVTANIRGRDLGSFVNEAQQRVDREIHVKAGQWIEWGGQYENLLSARHRLMWVVPLCFTIIFLLLFAALRSFAHAFMVFTGVPLAISGGIIALLLRSLPFSVTAAVGFIALSGVAVLNGLVMLTYIKQLQCSGHELIDAVCAGSAGRLRPVLMTALVASLGFVPMAIATGIGAEVQRPLAIVVIGGLISSTVLTLFVLPTIYYWYERAVARRASRSFSLLQKSQ